MNHHNMLKAFDKRIDELRLAQQKYVEANDLTWEYLATHGFKLLACRRYRDSHPGCTLTESHKTVTEFMEGVTKDNSAIIDHYINDLRD